MKTLFPEELLGLSLAAAIHFHVDESCNTKQFNKEGHKSYT